MYSDAEKFLLAFHALRPGVTADVFGAVPATCRGRPLDSTYAALVQALPAREPLTVLDIGCGNGHLVGLLARERPGARVVGVDFSLGELRAATGIAAPRLVAARAQVLPLRDASVDAVVSHLALMLMDDAPGVLREIARVLVPGGSFAAVVGGRRPPSPAFTTYVEILKRHLAALPQPAPRLGDAAFGSDEGIRALLDQDFTDIELEPLSIEERVSPEGAWSSYEQTYDPYHLSAEGRQAIREEYLQAVRPQVDTDGLLAFPQQLRCIRARRRRALLRCGPGRVPAASTGS